MENENLLSNELQVDSVGYQHLKEIAMWGRFLAIVGFILGIFIGIMAFFTGSILQSSGLAGATSSAMLTVMYLVIALITSVVSFYLYRFAIKLKLALIGTDQEELNDSLSNLKMVFRIYGIIVILYLGLMALGLIFGIAATAFR
jgi:small-conductance mechanosensitive channel